jgi:hypothetical protein
MAASSGQPVSGSKVFLVDKPETTPPLVIHPALLVLGPGKALKSVSVPFCHLKAC